MSPEERELLFTGRWITRNRITPSKDRDDLMTIFNTLLDGRAEAVLNPPTPKTSKLDVSRRKVAIVVGHNEKAPGAYAPAPIDKSEYDFNTAIAFIMQDAKPDDMEIKPFWRKPSLGYTEEIREVYGRVNEWGAVVSLELHFNSAGPGATGTETLVSTSKASTMLGSHIQVAMVNMLGLRDRGLKVVKREDRGGWSLYAGQAPAVLVEPFFASSPTDTETAARVGVQGFARMYLDGLRAYFKQLG